MNRQDLIQLINKTNSDRMKLMAGKSEDYASQEDTLGNFKRMQQVCDLLGVNTANTPWDCAMFLLLLKIDRLCNLHKGSKIPANEKTTDTIIDAHNYLDICDAIALEEMIANPNTRDDKQW